jgi:hypothetical protein
VTTVGLVRGPNVVWRNHRPDLIFSDLVEAVEFILKKSHQDLSEQIDHEH